MKSYLYIYGRPLVCSVDSLRNCARVARLRFDEGFTSYIEVLDAERFLFAAELFSTQLQAGLFRSLVNIYKALGGGWVTQAEGQK